MAGMNGQAVSRLPVAVAHSRALESADFITEQSKTHGCVLALLTETLRGREPLVLSPEAREGLCISLELVQSGVEDMRAEHISEYLQRQAARG